MEDLYRIILLQLIFLKDLYKIIQMIYKILEPKEDHFFLTMINAENLEEMKNIFGVLYFRENPHCKEVKVIAREYNDNLALVGNICFIIDLKYMDW